MLQHSIDACKAAAEKTLLIMKLGLSQPDWNWPGCSIFAIKKPGCPGFI